MLKLIKSATIIAADNKYIMLAPRKSHYFMVQTFYCAFIIISQTNVLSQSAVINSTYTDFDNEPESGNGVIHEVDTRNISDRNKTIIIGVLVRDTGERQDWTSLDAVASSVNIAVDEFQQTGALQDYTFKYVSNNYSSYNVAITCR